MIRDYLIVSKKILPEYYSKVVEARILLESSQCKSVSDAVKRVGISRSTAWRLQRRGDFPKPYVVSPGRVAYRESEVEAWKASRGHSGARPSRPVLAEESAAPVAPKTRRAKPTSGPAAPAPRPAPAAPEPPAAATPEPPSPVAAKAPRRKRAPSQGDQLSFGF